VTDRQTDRQIDGSCHCLKPYSHCRGEELDKKITFKRRQIHELVTSWWSWWWWSETEHQWSDYPTTHHLNSSCHSQTSTTTARPLWPSTIRNGVSVSIHPVYTSGTDWCAMISTISTSNSGFRLKIVRRRNSLQLQQYEASPVTQFISRAVGLCSVGHSTVL